nr:uncharacterized protein LOC111765980 isoform X1 [Dasypus novemcinctus]
MDLAAPGGQSAPWDLPAKEAAAHVPTRTARAGVAPIQPRRVGCCAMPRKAVSHGMDRWTPAPGVGTFSVAWQAEQALKHPPVPLNPSFRPVTLDPAPPAGAMLVLAPCSSEAQERFQEGLDTQNSHGTCRTLCDSPYLEGGYQQGEKTTVNAAGSAHQPCPPHLSRAAPPQTPAPRGKLESWMNPIVNEISRSEVVESWNNNAPRNF